MEVSIYKTKGVMIMYPLPVLFGIMLILLNGYCCGAAAVLVETNTTHTFRCDGRLDECLLEDDLELEFLINPYVSRLLQSDQSGTSGSANPDEAAFPPCGPQHPEYCATDAEKQKMKACANRGLYDRTPCK